MELSPEERHELFLTQVGGEAGGLRVASPPPARAIAETSMPPPAERSETFVRTESVGPLPGISRASAATRVPATVRR